MFDRLAEWLIKILSRSKSNNTDEMRLIISEVKELREYYKREFNELREVKAAQDKKIREQADKIQVLEEKVIVLHEMEELCLRQQAALQQNYIDMNEKLIFKTRGKHKDDDII